MLLPVLQTLKEVNLEYVVVDGRTFVTEHPHAMVRCEMLAYHRALLLTLARYP